MNLLDPFMPQTREARLRYLDADYEVLREGDFVRCAVSGNAIRLEDLKYWSVERQQAFASAETAFVAALTARLRSPSSSGE